MRIYANRYQSEKIIVALLQVYGSSDEQVLKVIENINKALLYQCKSDKKRGECYDVAESDTAIPCKE